MGETRGVTLKLGLLVLGALWWAFGNEQAEIEAAASIIVFGVGKLVVLYAVLDCFISALTSFWRPSPTTPKGEA